MKGFFKFLLPLLLISGFFAEAQTEVKARDKIAPLRGVRVNLWPDYGISDALNAITDFTAKRIPYLTAAELRSGGADSARAVLIIDPAIRGVFYHVPGSSAPDDGTKVIVALGKRFVKDTTEKHSIALVSEQVASIASSISNINNTSDLSKPISTATQTALNGKRNIGNETNPSWLTINKAFVGLGNVDNTPDTDKPVSTAQAAAIAAKVGKTGDESAAGIKTWTSLGRFSGPWSAGQAYFGSTGQPGRILFGRSSDGSAQARVGYTSAGENNKFEISNNSGSGTVGLTTIGGNGLMVFNDAKVRIQTGGTYTNTGEQLQVGGSLLVDGPSNTTGTATAANSVVTGTTTTANLTVGTKAKYVAPLYENNTAALANGEEIGTVFRDALGRLWSVIADQVLPVFTETLGDLVSRVFYEGTSSERQYKAQSAAKSWSVKKTSAGNTPVVRFEVRPGDYWATDSVDNNTHNGYYKERAEMYNTNPSTNLGYNTPWESTQWVSYRMMVEPGGDVIFPNPAHYCDLGQWHAKSGAGQATIKIDFRNQDEFRIYTHGHATTAGNGTLRLTKNLPRGVWHNIVMEIKHSQSATGGVFRMWINGVQEVSLTNIELGIRNETDAGYWKFGIYKSPNDKGLGGEEDLRVNLAVQYAAMKMSTTSLFDKVANPDPVAP